MLPADLEISTDPTRIDVDLVLSKKLIGAILVHADVAALKMILLRTRDAHGLYEQFGFAPVPSPHEMMVRYSER